MTKPWFGIFTVALLAVGHGEVVAAVHSKSNTKEFTLRSETLSAPERKAIYLAVLEDFIGWGEFTGKFVNWDSIEPGGGFFEAAGSGVSWARGNSNLCIAYGVLLNEFPKRQEFTRHNISRAVLQDHLRRTIRSLCLSNKNCSKHVAESHQWGGPSWQAALEFIGCAWAAHLREDSLDADTLALVTEVLAKEAENLDKPIPSGSISDTKSEDCSWNAPLLALAANKLSKDPRASKWDYLTKKWALNGSSTVGDRTSSQVVDGRPLSQWIVSENIFPDLTLENHGFWSVPYQYAYDLLGEAEIAYKVFGNPVPECFAFRTEAMWRKVIGVISLWDGDSLFPHGQDWAWKDYQHNEYFCWQATCRQNPEAGAFESRALQMVRKRQLAVGNGSLAALDFGYQCDLAKMWAFSYLMHKYFPAAEAMPYDKAETGFYGVHKYPYVKTAIHRTRKKLVSVSWHPRSQAIFILPEGNSTFTDPPFFFPYDRNSGIAKVNIIKEESTAKAGRITSRYPTAAYPPQWVIDRRLDTWWVSSRDNNRPGYGPTKDNPDWIQFQYPNLRTVSGLILYPRQSYGPKDCELQYSRDGKDFTTILRFTATNDAEQKFEFPEVRSRFFRLLVTSSWDPRSAQIREIVFLEKGVPTSKPLANYDLRTELETFAPIHNGKGMRVLVKRRWGDVITQYVTIVSLPDEATVYATIFHAGADAEVEIDPLFPLRTAAPPGFEKPVRQYRGKNWLNMSDHIAFVSPQTLPETIPAGLFFLTEKKKLEVQAGQWFNPAAVVVYVRQPHEQTEQLAGTIDLTEDLPNKQFKLNMQSSSGQHEIDLWPQP